MNRRLLFGSLGLIALILAFVLWSRRHATLSVTDSVKEPVASSNAQPHKAHFTERAVSNRPTGAVSAPTRLPTGYDSRIAAAAQQTVDQKNVPVHIFGLVIDQNSNALANVKIKATALQLTVGNALSGELFGSKSIPVERVTGADGRFEISGMDGNSLDLESISKDGYEVEPTKRGFGPTEGSYEKPIVFKMWDTNIHEKLITGTKKFQIVPDGRPYFINLNDGTINETGSGDLIIWIKRPTNINYGQRYNWVCEMDGLNGSGFVKEPDNAASMYQAPVNGYTNSFNYRQDAAVSGWGDTTGTMRFYVLLNNGREYGRISLELDAYYNNQIPGLVRFSYTINPSGSRILR